MNIRSLIFSSFLLLGYIQVSGQESKKEISVGFPVGKSTLDTTYADNASNLSDIVSYLESVKKERTLQLVEVVFSGSASPEGSFARNKTLAQQRSHSLEQYIRERIAIPDSIISRSEQVIPWKRLYDLVAKSTMPYKEEVLEVINNVPEFTYNSKGILVDSRKKHLQELRYGRIWHYMHNHFFEDIRNASLIVISVREKYKDEEKPIIKEQIIPKEPIDTINTEQYIEKVADIPSKKPKSIYMNCEE